MKKTRMDRERAKPERRLLLCAGRPVSLIILAGGRSRRMGRSKALLPVSGKTLLEHILAQVEGYFDDILVSLSPGQRLTPGLASSCPAGAARSLRGLKYGVPKSGFHRRGKGSLCRAPGGGHLERRSADKRKTGAAVAEERPPGERLPTLRIVRDAVRGQGPMAGVLAGLSAARHNVCAVVACDIPDVRVEFLRRLARIAGDGYDAVVPVSTEGLAEPLLAIYRRTTAPKMEKLLASGRRSLLPLLDKVKTCRFPLGDPFWLKNLNTPGEYRAYLEAMKERG
ncbi:MAG: molybdenum cofactor guanylyltransferase [Candidatus Aminicenantes bacterium]|nr:molybdenum cofactor guanylyltransferase [Candidatus Aminicenantes bacterium]